MLIEDDVWVKKESVGHPFIVVGFLWNPLAIEILSMFLAPHLSLWAMALNVVMCRVAS